MQQGSLPTMLTSEPVKIFRIISLNVAQNGVIDAIALVVRKLSPKSLLTIKMLHFALVAENGAYDGHYWHFMWSAPKSF